MVREQTLINGERAYSLREVQVLLGASHSTIYAHSATGALRTVNGRMGRHVLESELHRYGAARGYDIGAILAAREAAEAARAEVLAEREERQRGTAYDVAAERPLPQEPGEAGR